MCMNCKKDDCPRTLDDLLTHAQVHIQCNVRCSVCKTHTKSGNWSKAGPALNRLKALLSWGRWGFDAYGKPTCGDCLKRQEFRTRALADAIQKQKDALRRSFQEATGLDLDMPDYLRPIPGNPSTWRVHVPWAAVTERGGNVDEHA